MFDFIKNLDIKKISAAAKPLAISAGCMAAVFVAGFGAGKMHNGNAISSNTVKRSLSNYTTKDNDNKIKEMPAAPVNSTAEAQSSECAVKGSKSKIYHVFGGAFYERTNADKCFASEEEAQAAGYTKSSR